MTKTERKSKNEAVDTVAVGDVMADIIEIETKNGDVFYKETMPYTLYETSEGQWKDYTFTKSQLPAANLVLAKVTARLLDIESRGIEAVLEAEESGSKPSKKK